MNVGIITFHCSYNYGSALQAFALQKYINKHLGQAQVIDFVQPEDFKQYRLFRTHRYLHNPKSLAGDIVYMLPNWRRKRGFEGFLRRFVPMTPQRYTDGEALVELNEQFDAFICGSDQIWNPVCTGGVEPAYFLQFAQQDKKKVAYACSMGHSSLDAAYVEPFQKCMEHLDSISVREKTAQQYLSALTDRQIRVVLDPTLLLDKAEYVNMMPEGQGSGYIFVYMLEGCDALVAYAADLAQRTNKKIIYISRKREKWYKNGVNVYGAPPDLFLRYLHDADYVVTNSFHATVFSVLFEKQFCTFRTQKSFSRMEDLLSALGLSERLYEAGFDIDSPICYPMANARLQQLRAESVQYLVEALK